jgi:hypothetical protein
MVFSVQLNIGLKKNHHRWRFFRNLLGSRCCYVSLPLLHRLGAGMAKVKIAGKGNNGRHRAFHLVCKDYINNARRLASSFLAVNFPILHRL